MYFQRHKTIIIVASGNIALITFWSKHDLDFYSFTVFHAKRNIEHN